MGWWDRASARPGPRGAAGLRAARPRTSVSAAFPGPVPPFGGRAFGEAATPRAKNRPGPGLPGAAPQLCLASYQERRPRPPKRPVAG